MIENKRNYNNFEKNIIQFHKPFRIFLKIFMAIMVYNHHHICQQNCTERLWYLATVSAHYEKIDKNSAKFLVSTSLQKTHFSMALQKTTISGMSARSGFFTSQVCFEDEWANQSKVDKTQ